MQGGTAADAAVAILATLNAVEPMNSGAGGNGFMTIYDKASDQVYSLNATGAAPRALNASELTAAELARGIKSGVTPGLFGGWIAVLERFGTMRLGQVLAPAIEYAEHGHVLDSYVANSIAFYQEMFEAFDTTATVYLHRWCGARRGATREVLRPGANVQEARRGGGHRGRQRPTAPAGAARGVRPVLQG